MDLQTQRNKTTDDLRAQYGKAGFDLLDAVVFAASLYWEECPEDFCLQHVNPEVCIVFGSTNRIVWSIKNGFRVDASYCTAKFLAHADKFGG
jgi:hypothetical protein